MLFVIDMWRIIHFLIIICKVFLSINDISLSDKKFSFLLHVNMNVLEGYYSKFIFYDTSSVSPQAIQMKGKLRLILFQIICRATSLVRSTLLAT